MINRKCPFCKKKLNKLQKEEDEDYEYGSSPIWVDVAYYCLKCNKQFIEKTILEEIK